MTGLEGMEGILGSMIGQDRSVGLAGLTILV